MASKLLTAQAVRAEASQPWWTRRDPFKDTSAISLNDQAQRAIKQE
jgi:hypothetical protein